MNKLETLQKFLVFAKDLLKASRPRREAEYGSHDDVGEDEYDGLSEVDDPNWDTEDDEAAKWLKEQEANTRQRQHPQDEDVSEPVQTEAKSPKKYLRDWTPKSDYAPHEKEAVDKLMSEGYSHREAERLAGVHKAPSDFRQAMRSGIAPSMISDKMFETLKPLAREWLENADRHEKMNADPEANTVKRMSGKMMQAQEQHLGDYNKAYNDFLASDQLKNLKGRERHQAIQDWKSKWKQGNEGHENAIKQVSAAQRQYGYDQKAARQSANDKWNAIISGAHAGSDMSDQEALQHLGAGKTEEGYQGTIAHNSLAALANKHQHIISKLTPEQHERKKAVDSAAFAQKIVRRPRGSGNAN